MAMPLAFAMLLARSVVMNFIKMGAKLSYFGRILRTILQASKFLGRI